MEIQVRNLITQQIMCNTEKRRLSGVIEIKTDEVDALREALAAYQANEGSLERKIKEDDRLFKIVLAQLRNETASQKIVIKNLTGDINDTKLRLYSTQHNLCESERRIAALEATLYGQVKVIKALTSDVEAKDIMLQGAQSHARYTQEQVREAQITENKLSSAERQIRLLEIELAAARKVKPQCDQGIQVGNDFVRNKGSILRSIAGPATEASKAQRVLMMKVAGLCDSKSIQANGVGIVSTEQDKVLYVSSRTAVNPITITEVENAVRFAASAIHIYESQQVPQGSVTVDCRMSTGNAEQFLKARSEEKRYDADAKTDNTTCDGMFSSKQGNNMHSSSKTHVKEPKAAAAIQDKAQEVQQKGVSAEHNVGAADEERENNAEIISLKGNLKCVWVLRAEIESLQQKLGTTQHMLQGCAYLLSKAQVRIGKMKVEAAKMAQKQCCCCKYTKANAGDVVSIKQGTVIFGTSSQTLVNTTAAEKVSKAAECQSSAVQEDEKDQGPQSSVIADSRMSTDTATQCLNMASEEDKNASNEKKENANGDVVVSTKEVKRLSISASTLAFSSEVAAALKEEGKAQASAIMQKDGQVPQTKKVTAECVMSAAKEDKGLQTICEEAKHASHEEKEGGKLMADPTPLSDNGHKEDVRYSRTNSVDRSEDQHSQTHDSSNASTGYTSGEISSEVEAKIGAGVQVDSVSGEELESTAQDSSAYMHDSNRNDMSREQVARKENEGIFSRFSVKWQKFKTEIIGEVPRE